MWRTVWDTDADAIEFDQAIRATCSARMPQGALLPPVVEGFKLWGEPDPGTSALLVAHRGKEVTFVAGASAVQARAILAALYPSLVPAPASRPAPKAAPTAGGARH